MVIDMNQGDALIDPGVAAKAIETGVAERERKAVSTFM